MRFRCAIFGFYDLPRFSFDLDFDLIKPLASDDFDRVREVLSARGKILDAQDKQYTTFFLFDYAKGHHKIKIELNKRIWKNNVYKNVWFMGLLLAVPDETTLFTNKLVALSNRKSPVARDLFDVWFFLSKGFSIRDELIKERTGKNTNEYLEFLSAFIRKTYTRSNVLQGLGEALDDKQKIWVKDHLIEDAISEIKKRMR